MLIHEKRKNWGGIRIGLIGASPGNGHPFSFGAILNGYDPTHYSQIGWSGIVKYVTSKDESEFGIGDARVVSVWTQYPKVTRTLAAGIGAKAALSPENFIGDVDAVIIARDDYDTHWRVASKFLRCGLPVFIDKPLAPSLDTLRLFLPYLERKQLMTGSGLRFMPELDYSRNNLKDFGRIRLIRGVIVGPWESYGIHLLEGIFGIKPFKPTTLTASLRGHMSAQITTDSDTIIQLNALGNSPKILRVEIFGQKRFVSADASDNFVMFRRLLSRFVAGVVNPGTGFSIPVSQVVDGMRILRAARISHNEKRTVSFDERKLKVRP
jgi:hypothetical protein